MRKQKTLRSLTLFKKHANRILRKVFHKSRPSWGLLKERVMKMTKISSLWLRRDCTTSHSSNVLLRVGLATFVVAIILFLLTACGGGGGSSFAEDPIGGGTPPPTQPPVTPPVTPPPVAVKKGTLVLSTCQVQVDKTTCDANATATSLENVTATVFQVTGGDNVAGPGPVALSLRLGAYSVVLNGDGQKLDEKSGTVSCAPGLVQQGTTCMKPTATGTLAVPVATVANDASTATVVVSFTSNHTSALSVTLGSETKTVPSGSGDVTFTRTGVADLPVSLKDNGIQIANGVSKASCNPVAKWDASTSVCREVLAHTDTVVAVWDLNNRFYFVGETGFTEVKNLTPWNNMGANLFYYFGGIKQGVTDEFCRIRVVAVDSVSRVWRQMYIDAKRKELRVLPGTEAVLDFDPQGSYDFVHEYDPALLNAAAYAKVSIGEFYTPADDEFKLLFKPTGQDARLVYPWVGSEGGALKVMRSSTCK